MLSAFLLEQARWQIRLSEGNGPRWDVCVDHEIIEFRLQSCEATQYMYQRLVLPTSHVNTASRVTLITGITDQYASATHLIGNGSR